MASRVNQNAISKIAKNLIPLRVLIVRSTVDLVNVPVEAGEDILIQAAMPSCKELEAESSDGFIKKYKFRLGAGIRYVDSKLLNDDESNMDECVIGSIFSEYEVVYATRSGKPCEDADLEHFSVDNVPLHVWPYWREFTQSACTRAGIKPPAIGMHMIEKYEDNVGVEFEDGAEKALKNESPE